MSLFSENIIEDPWVGMVYKFWNCTNPRNMDDTWKDAFKINFSKSKLRDKVKELLMHNGVMKLSEQEFDEINQTLNQHSIFELSTEYQFIILICLIVPTLNEENLSDILTSCLKQTKLNSYGTVSTRVRFREKEFTYITIHVNTFTPQRIEITLKRKNS